MKISSIQLERYRSFVRKVTFRLPGRGLVYLTGRNLVQPELEGNGVGKSSLFEGVYWVLFGRTSQGLKAGSVANWKHPKGCKGMVHGEHLGKEVVVERTWNPNLLKLNGEEVDQVTLESKLGISPDTFLHSWFFPQFSSSFLDLKPEQKMSLLVELLKLQVWDNASELASMETGELEKEIQIKQARCEEILATLEELDYHDLAKRESNWTEEKRKELSLLGAEIHRQEKLGKNEESLSQALARAKRKAYSLQEKHADAKAELRQLEASIQNLSGAASVCPTCGAKLDVLHRKSEMAKTSRRRSDISARLRDDAARAEKAEQDHRRLQQRLDSLAEVRELRKRMVALKREANPYTEQRREILGKRNKASLRLTRFKHELTHLRKNADATKFWIKGFKEVRLLVVNSVIAQLEAEVNQTIHELGLEDWQVRFDVERETKSGGISRGFTTEVLSPDNDEPVPWESWSGGERQRLKLAGTMGFANLINGMTGQNPNVEFWDEPSSWMSQRGIDQMLESLAERARKYGRCIIIADHRALGFGGFSKRITVVKDRHGSYIEGTLRLRSTS